MRRFFPRQPPRWLIAQSFCGAASRCCADAQRAFRDYRLLPFLMALVVVLAASACALIEKPGPQEVVAEFCKQDLLGARIVSGGQGKIADYVGWGPEPDWSKVFVIAGYRVSPSKRLGEMAEVKVTYEVRGVLEGRRWQSWSEGKGRRRRLVLPTEVTFRLASTPRGNWVIIEPQLPPHISLAYVGEHIPIDEIGP